MLLDDVKELPISKWGPLLRPEVSKHIKIAAPQARCYVFDDEASFKLGQFILSCPDLIAEQLEFAIPPYPITYVEVVIDQVVKGIGRATNVSQDRTDHKVGFLRSDTIIYTMVCNKQYTQTLAGVYGLTTSGISPQDADTLYHAAAYLLGSTYHDLTPAQHKRFTDTYTPMYFGPPEIAAIARKEILQGHMGEARIYAAALLLLHQKKAIALTEKPAYRTMYRGKSRPFMAHNVVTITLDSPVQIRKAMSSGSGETRRAHEVPAHYAHRHGTRNCEHTWQKREDEENHWDCTKCGRFRYLRRHHMRGDASKGFVKKSYNVTTEDAK